MLVTTSEHLPELPAAEVLYQERRKSETYQVTLAPATIILKKEPSGEHADSPYF